jgi:thiol-disulfide isomerase/thioredoxin
MRILVRAEQKSVSEETVGSCQIETLKKIGEEKKYSNGYFLFFSQPKCGDCDAMRELLDQKVKDLRPIVEASLEDKSCGKLADSFKIEITPTVLYIQKGEERKRIAPDGKITWQDVDSQITELASFSTA